MCIDVFIAFYWSHLVYYPKFIANCTKVLEVAKQFASNWCSIVACIQSVSSAINWNIKATMHAGIHAVKLNAIIGCRQIVTIIGCSIILFIQSVWSSCNHSNKSQEYMQSNGIKVFDADTFLPVLDAASSSASKVFQVTAISLKVLKINKSF